MNASKETKSLKSPLLWGFFIFFILWIHGGTLGASDDEAYYWVLSQKLELGYAFHPPMVAWILRFFQAVLDPFFSSHSIWILRFPAALISGVTVVLAGNWFQNLGLRGSDLRLAFLNLLAFAGFFGASWMWVPDLPLLLGWILLFVSTWKYNRWNISQPRNVTIKDCILFVFATALVVLSKFSGLIAVGSAGLIILSSTLPFREKGKACCAFAVGLVLAALPILIWNSQHEWGALLYQFKDRHSGSEISFIRYGRFWLIQFIIVGPFVLVFTVKWLRSLFARPTVQTNSGIPQNFSQNLARVIAIWAIPPALVFFTQPLWSDFKPHWALVVWLPIILGFSAQALKFKKLSFAHRTYGFSLIVLVAFICRFPLISVVIHEKTGNWPDPRIDISNDLTSWSELPRLLRESLGEERARSIPVLASRYQTASQAALALGSWDRVALIPRDLKQRDEWPSFSIFNGDDLSGKWPHFNGDLIFVSDHRYTAGPEFPNARCDVLNEYSGMRWNVPVRSLKIWHCYSAVSSKN